MPPVTSERKGQIVSRLMTLHQGLMRLRLALVVAGKDAKADQLTPNIDELTRLIDELLKRQILDWLDAAADVETRLGQANLGLKKSIQAIKASQAKAKDIVKAIGFIDDALSIGRKLLTGL